MSIYNGHRVQEIFELRLQELKERLRQKIRELHATCSTSLTKAVLSTVCMGSCDPGCSDTSASRISQEADHIFDDSAQEL